jgi:hypothetical protein
MAPIKAEERDSGNMWIGRWAIACCRGEKKIVLFLVEIGRRFLGHQIPCLVTTATELARIRFNIALPVLQILIFPCPNSVNVSTILSPKSVLSLLSANLYCHCSVQITTVQVQYTWVIWHSVVKTPRIFRRIRLSFGETITTPLCSHSLQFKVSLNTTSITSRIVKQLHVPTLYPVLHQASYKTESKRSIVWIALYSRII